MLHWFVLEEAQRVSISLPSTCTLSQQLPSGRTSPHSQFTNKCKFHHLIHLLTITDTHTPSHLSTHQTSPHPPTQPTIPDLNWPDWSGVCSRLLAHHCTLGTAWTPLSNFSETFMDFRAPQISHLLNPKSFSEPFHFLGLSSSS